MLTLQITQDCNLRCKYCIYTQHAEGRQRAHSQKHMDYKTATEGIDFLWSHSIDSKAVNLGFYGGEPLLEFDLLQQCISYAESKFKGKSIKFSLTTNATLLTDQIIEYFMNHNIDLTISLDGPKEIHDYNRIFAGSGKGSFDVVIKKIEHLIERYPEYLKRVNINMVIDPQNNFDQISSLLERYPVLSKINIITNMLDTSATGKPLLYSKSFLEKMNYQEFLSCMSSIGRYPKNKVSFIIGKKLDRVRALKNTLNPINGLPDTFAPSGPCYPGCIRLFMNADGDFFPCERVNELSNDMKIGNVQKGFNLANVIRLLNVAQVNGDRCKNCWAFLHCGICAQTVCDDEAKISAKELAKHCLDIRSSLEERMRMLILKEEIPTFYEKRG